MNFNFINALTPLQWVLLALVPPAIISLYFLKLKRHPVEVPSTYLWTRTIEDLHVNSIWQKLRQSLLLFLQLLLLALAILACTRPGWRGMDLVGDRFIFLLDASASMNATDVSPTRLDAAKQRALDLIEQMESSDVAMVISFSDVPRIEQTFTNNRSALRQAVNKIKATNRTTDLREALRAASGLANPGRISQKGTNDVQVADALPATMYIVSDGGFDQLPEFSPGNLDAEYIKIGTAAPSNVGVVAFSTERNAEKAGQLQAFARIENTSDAAVEVDVSLFLNDTLADASRVSIPADAAEGVSFALRDVQDGVLKVEVQHKDHLALDNLAYAPINTPRRARVLVVTSGNDALKLALTTEAALKIADVAFVGPEALATKEHRDAVLAGSFDLIIYDRCVPTEMPEANTLFIGAIPPAEGWKGGERQQGPQVIDTDRMHPLMYLVELGTVLIFDAIPMTGPQGAATLIDADQGPLLMIAPRKSFEDAVLAFELVGAYPDGEVNAKTNWPRRRSFPLFVMNVLRYLGGGRTELNASVARPGSPIKLRTEVPAERITVESPTGIRTQVEREGESTFVYTQTDELGIYTVREGNARDAGQRFAINLFDARESDLVPRATLELGYEQPLVGAGSSTPTRKELWKWLLIGGLGVLVFEWYIYNRRVYL